MHIKVIHPLQTHRTRISRKNIAYIIAKRDKKLFTEHALRYIYLYTYILVLVIHLYTFVIYNMLR